MPKKQRPSKTELFEFHPDLKVEQNAHDLDVTRLEIHNVFFFALDSGFQKFPSVTNSDLFASGGEINKPPKQSSTCL